MDFNWKKHWNVLRAMVVWIVILTCIGCGPARVTRDPTAVPGEVYTQVAGTIVAEITRTAEAMPTHEPIDTLVPQPSKTATMASPTATRVPSPLPSETPTLTLTLPVSGTLGSTETITPTATELLDVAYFDDFSENTGWFTINAPDHATDYYQGGYRIQINGAETPIWSTRKRNYPNVHLGVDASLLSGSLTGYFGLICRQQEGGGYYGLVISGDGTYGIGKSHGGSFTFLQQGRDLTGAFTTGYEMNRISADCIGDRMTLFVNDVKLLEVQDEEFSAGYIGLLVGTRSEANIAVLFDNFGAVQR